MSTNPIVLRVEVEGSKGKKYVVSQRTKGNWACSCPGWIYHTPRRDCKHIRNAKETKAQLEAQPEFAFVHRPVVGGLRA